jgi:HSP20 family protein
MNSIIRHDPFNEMMALRGRMDRLFDDFFGSPLVDRQPDWNLALDVAESQEEFLVKAAIPGISPDDLEITFSDNTLTIKGEVKVEKETKEAQYHLRERRYGRFSRSISLPNTIKADGIVANYEAGVLTLHLPKTEAVKPKRISVSTSSPKIIEGTASEVKEKVK